MHRILKSTKKAIPLLVVLYGLYLLKTLLGINVSNQYSANWIFKVPLEPVLASKGRLCQELESACAARQDLRVKVQRGLKKAKRAI